ncbi:hypothetical protein [Edaphobacter bradus]|uniref:hypothetical protein n=1 Tax=Edaphobacter bradus TaxID=2259016 RepID=UPI0021DFDCEE|nr:hypothetical protein [Edaphobacter bradus]
MWENAADDEVRKEQVQFFLVRIVKSGGEEMPPALEGLFHDKGETLVIFEFDTVIRQRLESLRYIWSKSEIGGFSRTMVDNGRGVVEKRGAVMALGHNLGVVMGGLV